MYYFRALSSEIISLSKALWVQQFKETADHLANGNRVTLIQIFPKMIVFVQSIAGWFLPQFSDELRKVICDKAIVICKMLWTEFPIRVCSNAYGQGMPCQFPFQVGTGRKDWMF